MQSQCCVSLCTLKILCTTLQSDYCNWVHFDKVALSDYRKLTILWTKKVCCEPISTVARKKKKKKKKKTGLILEAQNLDIDRKRFSGKQMFHQSIFFYLKLDIYTVTSKGHI